METKVRDAIEKESQEIDSFWEESILRINQKSGSRHDKTPFQFDMYRKNKKQRDLERLKTARKAERKAARIKKEAA